MKYEQENTTYATYNIIVLYNSLLLFMGSRSWIINVFKSLKI